MKHLKSFILVAIIGLSVGSAPAAFAGAPKPVSGIDVIVQKTPDGKATRQKTTAPTKDGSVSVQLPAAGTYKISYADGPKKGQLIETVTVKKPGPHIMHGVVSLIK